MTDGEATIGITDPLQLSKLVSEEYINIFLGFGIEHDSMMLSKLSDNLRSEYRFIDKLENSGLVYGEIVHNILYSSINEVHITIENGLIYNWKTNEWMDKIYISQLHGNSNKIYHIKTCTPDTVVVHMNGIKSEESFEYDIELLPNLLNNDGSIINQNLMQYIFRQKTQELLFKVVKVKSKHSRINYNYDNGLKSELYNLLTRMQEFMNDDNRQFMKLLCDDVYIAHKTFDSKYAEMYSRARQTSQGSQCAYNVSDLSDMEKTMVYEGCCGDDDEDNDTLVYNMSQCIDTPYISNDVLNMMKDMSM